MHLLARSFAFATLTGFAATATAGEGTWTRTSDVGSDPVSKTTREQYDLDADARVDVREIGGSVEIKAGVGARAEVVYTKRAASQKDFDCETLKVEHRKDELRIWVEHKRERACRVVRASDDLTVTIPRGASLAVEEVGDEVTVDGVEGMVRLSDIGNRVTITGAHQVDAHDIGNSVDVTVTKLGIGGIRLADIGNKVQLELPEQIDARVMIHDVGDEIRGPGLRRRSGDDDDSYEGVLGKGGPTIRIEDVGNDVVIRGPQMGRGRAL